MLPRWRVLTPRPRRIWLAIRSIHPRLEAGRRRRCRHPTIHGARVLAPRHCTSIIYTGRGRNARTDVETWTPRAGVTADCRLFPCGGGGPDQGPHEEKTVYSY